MSWKDDKDLGSWEFTEQPNKWGYLNNPKWSEKTNAQEFSEAAGNPIDPTDTHKPCGHWHKETEPRTGTILTTEAIWQQSIDVLKSEELLGVAGMSKDSDTEYILYITDFDGSIEASYLWETEGDVSGFPGTINIIKVGSTPTVFYINFNLNEDDDPIYYVYKIDANGNYSRSLIFESTIVDASNYEYIYYQYNTYTMAVSSTGTIVTAIAVYECIDDVYRYYIHTRRSEDWGVSWEDKVEISVTDGFLISPCVRCDSSGVFYITTMDFSTPAKPFRLWRSTDNGASWSEVATVPTTAVITTTDLNMDISGSKIYVAALVWDSGWKTYIWLSTDSGATWDRRNVTVTGITYFARFGITANGDVVILSGRGTIATPDYIIRSDDGGTTWTKIGQRDPALDWPTYIEDYEEYISLNNDDDMFVFTACGDYILNTNYLGYLFSEDDGLTWEAKALPLSRVSGVPSYGAIPTLPDEPQVWPMD